MVPVFIFKLWMVSGCFNHCSSNPAVRNSRLGLQGQPGKPILSTDLFHRTAELFYDVYVGWPRAFFGVLLCLRVELRPFFSTCFVFRGWGWGWAVVRSFFPSICVCVFFVVRGCGGLALPAVDECRCNMWFMDNRYSVCTF